MSGRIELRRCHFGRVELTLRNAADESIVLKSVATHPILGYFLRKIGLAKRLKTTTGAFYVNTNSLWDRLYNCDGILAQDKKKTLSAIKKMLKAERVATSKTFDYDKIHAIYTKIQALKNPAPHSPQNVAAGQVINNHAQVLNNPAPSIEIAAVVQAAETIQELKEEGGLLEGKRTGQWRITHPNGNYEEGQYVDDKREGIWTTTYSVKANDGDAGTTKIKNDLYLAGIIQTTTVGCMYKSGSSLKKFGLWETTYLDGSKESFNFSNDQLNGFYVKIDANGDQTKGYYLQGQKNGDWTTTFANGEKETIHYDGACKSVLKLNAEGKIIENTHYKNEFRHGKWLKVYGNGMFEDGQYNENRKEGLWRIQLPTGEIDEVHYQLGLIQGQGVRIHSNGDREEGVYINNERVGKWIKTNTNGDVVNANYYFRSFLIAND